MAWDYFSQWFTGQKYVQNWKEEEVKHKLVVIKIRYYDICENATAILMLGLNLQNLLIKMFSV